MNGLREVDFFSIGTNDLVLYTLAVDRQNAQLEELGKASHPAVLRLIHKTIRAGHDAVSAGICGEAAADPELIPIFIEMGVDELSMSAARIPSNKKNSSAACPKKACFMQLAFKKAVTDAIKKQPDRRVMPFLYENEPYFIKRRLSNHRNRFAKQSVDAAFWCEVYKILTVNQ